MLGVFLTKRKVLEIGELSLIKNNKLTEYSNLPKEWCETELCRAGSRTKRLHCVELLRSRPFTVNVVT